MASSGSNQIKVSESDLRERYNKSGIPGYLVSGFYQLSAVKSRPASVAVNQPAGTLSVMYDVLDPHGAIIAKVHAFVLPNGQLGASGKYDPKSLKDGNVRYFV